MTDITASPNPDFSLSSLDRQRPGGPWLHSFLGTIRLEDDDVVVQENDVPVVFLLCALIEACALAKILGVNPKDMPIPSTDRKIKMNFEQRILTIMDDTEANDFLVHVSFNEDIITYLFRQIVGLMRIWKPVYLDDKNFVRSNWIIGAALDQVDSKMGPASTGR